MATNNYASQLGLTSVDDKRWAVALNALFERTLRTMLNKHTLKFHNVTDAGAMAATDGKDVYVDVLCISSMLSRNKANALLAYRGLVYHEMAHIMFSPFGQPRADVFNRAAQDLRPAYASSMGKGVSAIGTDEVRTMQNCVGTWWMLIEEGRIEHFLIRKYRRMAAYLRWLFVYETKSGAWIEQGYHRSTNASRTPESKMKATQYLLLTYGRRYLPKKVRRFYLRKFRQEFPALNEQSFKILKDELLKWERTPYGSRYTVQFSRVMMALFDVVGREVFMQGFNAANKEKVAQHSNAGSSSANVMQGGLNENSAQEQREAAMDAHEKEARNSNPQYADDASDDNDDEFDNTPLDAPGDAGEDMDGEKSDGASPGGESNGDADGDAEGSGKGQSSKSSKRKSRRNGKGVSTGKSGGTASSEVDMLDEMRSESEDAIAGDEATNDLMQTITSYLNNNTVMLPEERRWRGRQYPVLPDMRGTLTRMAAHFAPLVENTDSYWERRTHNGRLNMSSVIKAQGRSFDVFDSWHESLEQEATFEIVVGVDLSGSMGGSADRVSQTAWVIKSMCDSLNMPCTVMLYESEMGYAYDRNVPASRDKYISFAAEGGTNPITTIYNASAILSKSPMKHKLFIMLTDGSWGGVRRPRAGGARSVEAETMTSAMHAMNSGGVSTVLLLFNMNIAAFRAEDTKMYDFNEVYECNSVALVAEIAAKFVRVRLRQVVGF
jgi:uncharacterized protein with von Willebrand factor type A (vWA) domain